MDDAERTGALLEALARPNDIPRAQRVYANRNLRLDRVRMIGFDMDYTLALYDQPALEAISIDATIDKLIEVKGYPDAIRTLTYDPQMAIRGLVVDMETGNVVKPDRYGAVTRGYHGLQPLDRALLAELYHRQRVRLSSERFAFIDTLFALPEAVLYSSLIDYFDRRVDEPPQYTRMWHDIRECIDLAHRDGSIKTIIANDIPRFIQPDPHLADTLHKMRSSGKKLFLLTNSDFEYTDPVMRYLLDGALDAYPRWRNLFDIIVVSAMKPAFFTEKRPFFEVGENGKLGRTEAKGPFVRGRVYSGGNHKDFEAMSGARGDRVLFVGDHIYGDMLRSRKSSAWRTVMLIQELEREIAVHDKHEAAQNKLEDLERQLRHLDSDIEEKQHILRTLQKLKPEVVDQAVEDGKKTAREMVDLLRTELRAAMSEHAGLEQQIDRSFNPFWGPLFKEGREVSKFGDQVEEYAFVYTSRVSNFRHYSPMRHFRGPRDRMPHER